MPNVALALLSLVLQVPARDAGPTTPAGGDTVGYWQQRVHYRITALLDEREQKVRANGRLWYVNNSPDTLRQLYFQQYLNAFRPDSRWSAVDEREGRDRFQRLKEPDFAYERFTAPVRVNNVAVTPEYPGAPDSTVVRVSLPAALPPRDSVEVVFAWDARPSAVPRRQGRSGRHWDLPQWFPKVAVYDRHGWQYNALRPAGEFYGEFGTYDVTLIVHADQIVAATGVPVAGDPGWARVSRAGPPRLAAHAYGEQSRIDVEVPTGFKAVRFLARDVHHFAWSASPDYRYEGGVYARPAPATRFQTWDTVSVHVLYRPGDDSTWGGQRVVTRTIAALRWFEALIGPYPWPQLTAQHRIDGGGSETPMMMMNGSPSQGLILHEGGHMYFYGALANNEWRSGWMDEGMASYETAWAQLLTPLERMHAGITDRFTRPPGYRRHAISMALPRFEIVAVNQATLDITGQAQPLGTIAHEFRNFDIYNDITYDRAEVMFSQLRDVLGDSTFVVFIHDYYARWALKHVDPAAMQASAERVSRRDLGWFFSQWVNHTGVMDYRLSDVRSSRDAAGTWTTVATVSRHGEYRHPMPVGVRTQSGWTLGRMTNFPYDRETIRVVTAEEPLEVRLDPVHVTWDWDRRNDKAHRPWPRFGVDWPFLQQADRERQLSLWLPIAWYSRPGGVNAGIRGRTHYLSDIDKLEGGVVAATADGLDLDHRLQFWLRFENPYLPMMTRPAMGWRGGAARLDDVIKLDLGYRGVAPRFPLDASVNYTITQGQELLPDAWIGNPSSWSFDADVSARRQWGSSMGTHAFVSARAVIGSCDGCWYNKDELTAGVVKRFSENTRLSARGYFGFVPDTSGDNAPPGQRALYVSAQDPVTTFGNHWWRPRESILKQPDVNWLPLGGAALRGYHWSVRSNHIGAANLDMAVRAGTIRSGFGSVDFWVSLFGDAGYESVKPLIDAGPGIKLEGQFFDQPVNLRIDFPVFVNQPALALDRHGRSDQFAPRWLITFNDIW